MNKWIMIGGGAVLLVGLSVGASIMVTGTMDKDSEDTQAEEEQENPLKNAQYITLEPEFLVNFHTETRPNIMSAEVSISALDELAVASLNQHMPVIRNSLLMLFNEQDPQKLITSEGKEELRKTALASVQQVLDERDGTAKIDDVFFTRFIME